MKRFLLVLGVVVWSCAFLKAQDDELPPPSSHPYADQTGVHGSGKNKKRDLSNYIIEPDLVVCVIKGGYNQGV